MPNKLKGSGEGVALQVTKAAREAGLVNEDSRGKSMSLATVCVYSFNNVLLVVDREEMDTQTVADLLAVTAKDTKRIYRGVDASMEEVNDGVTVQLPPADVAGFTVGDVAVAHPAPNLLVITKRNPDGAQLANDIVSMRRDQVAVA